MIKPVKHVVNIQRSHNYLVIVYLVKKFIQHLKSCLSVKRLLAVKQFHLSVLNDRTSFYKDGKQIVSTNPKINLSLLEIKSKKSIKIDFVKLSINIF